MIKGETPSEDELFYKRWARETLKANISVLNDVLKLFVALDVAILSAYLGFYGRITVASWLKLGVFVLMLVSLSSAIVGLYPRRMRVNLNLPCEIKAYKSRRVDFKARCLLVAVGTVLLAFVALLIALSFA